MHTDPEHDASRKAGYELSDVASSPVAIAIAALVGLMVAGFIGGYAFKKVFEATEVYSRPEASPLVRREAVRGPLLQPHPEVELEDYRASQRARLETAAWVDREQGRVRIPIEEAMKIIARDGFPKWEAETAKLPEAEPEGATGAGE